MSRRLPDERPSRVVLENVRPVVDDARFAVKRTIGEQVRVSADVFADGHEHLAGVLRYRLADALLQSHLAPRTSHLAPDLDWHETPLEKGDNDRWSASFRVLALGRYEYTLEAWVDRFGSWRDEISKK